MIGTEKGAEGKEKEDGEKGRGNRGEEVELGIATNEQRNHWAEDKKTDNVGGIVNMKIEYSKKGGRREGKRGDEKKEVRENGDVL